MRHLPPFFILSLYLAGGGQAAATEPPWLLFENVSAHDVKVVVPARAFIIKAGAPAERVTFEADDSLDVDLNIWWKNNPRELCQISTPWSRRVRIAGQQTIVCLSNDPS